MNPKYPLYIPSKGRYEIRLTSNYLTYMKVSHYIVIEEQEYDLYLDKTKDNNFVTLLVLDKKYQQEYKTLDDLGGTKSKGPGAARNFAWQHSIDNGFDYHWVIDPDPWFMSHIDSLADEMIQCSPAETAISIGHLQMWKEFLASDAETAMFLEDDIYFDYQFVSFLTAELR